MLYWNARHSRFPGSGHAPLPGKVTLAGALGFGLPLLAWVITLIPLFKGNAESLHGEASFADLADLKKAGLLKQTPQSILIGKYKGRLAFNIAKYNKEKAHALAIAERKRQLKRGKVMCSAISEPCRRKNRTSPFNSLAATTLDGQFCPL